VALLLAATGCIIFALWSLVSATFSYD
jgi:hypothetical protein